MYVYIYLLKKSTNFGIMNHVNQAGKKNIDHNIVIVSSNTPSPEAILYQNHACYSTYRTFWTQNIIILLFIKTNVFLPIKMPKLLPQLRKWCTNYNGDVNKNSFLFLWTVCIVKTSDTDGGCWIYIYEPCHWTTFTVYDGRM